MWSPLGVSKCESTSLGFSPKVSLIVTLLAWSVSTRQPMPAARLVALGPTATELDVLPPLRAVMAARADFFIGKAKLPALSVATEVLPV